MKKLSALIAMLFASASVSVFAQATPAKPAEAASRRRRRTRQDRGPAKAEAPKKASHQEGREEEARPRRSTRRSPRPRPPRKPKPSRKRHEARTSEEGRAQEVIGRHVHGKAGPRPRLLPLRDLQFVHEDRRRPLRGRGFRRGRAAAQARRATTCVGLFMKNWEDDDDDEYCSTREDLVDAVSAAETIGIDVEAVNFAAEYRERVFAQLPRRVPRPAARPTPTCSATPRSSSRPSSTTRWRWAPSASPPATTRACEERDGRHVLLKGVDPAQGPELLPAPARPGAARAHAFPSATCSRPRCAASPREAGLPNHAKRDSTGICFIGERPFREFLARYLPREPGPIATPEGERVGEHQGLMYYTIGQRQGTRHRRAARRPAASRGTWRARTSPANTLVVVQGHDHPLLLQSAASRPTTRAGSRRAPAETARRSRAKTRYRQADAACAAARRGATLRARVRRAPMGGDAGAIGGALSRRGVPGRRRDRLGFRPAERVAANDGARLERARPRRSSAGVRQRQLTSRGSRNSSQKSAQPQAMSPSVSAARSRGARRDRLRAGRDSRLASCRAGARSTPDPAAPPRAFARGRSATPASAMPSPSASSRRARARSTPDRRGCRLRAGQGVQILGDHARVVERTRRRRGPARAPC